MGYMPSGIVRVLATNCIADVTWFTDTDSRTAKPAASACSGGMVPVTFFAVVFNGESAAELDLGFT